MQETIEQSTIQAEAADAVTTDAARASTWAGEPFLHEGEDAAGILAPGTARRRALDDALSEIDAGLTAPSP
jgi:ribonuclease E